MAMAEDVAATAVKVAVPMETAEADTASLEACGDGTLGSGDAMS